MGEWGSGMRDSRTKKRRIAKTRIILFDAEKRDPRDRRRLCSTLRPSRLLHPGRRLLSLFAIIIEFRLAAPPPSTSSSSSSSSSASTSSSVLLDKVDGRVELKRQLPVNRPDDLSVASVERRLLGASDVVVVVVVDVVAVVVVGAPVVTLHWRSPEFPSGGSAASSAFCRFA